MGGGTLLGLRVSCEQFHRVELEVNCFAEKVAGLLEIPLVDRRPGSGPGLGYDRVVRNQALRAGIQGTVFIGLRFQTSLQFDGIVRQRTCLTELAEDGVQDSERNTFVRLDPAQDAQDLVPRPFDPSYSRCRPDREIWQQALATYGVGQDGSIGGFDEALTELPHDLVDAPVGGPIMVERSGAATRISSPIWMLTVCHGSSSAGRRGERKVAAIWSRLDP